MHNGLLILIGLIGAARLIASGQASIVGIVVLGLVLGVVVLWLALKAWMAVRR